MRDRAPSFFWIGLDSLEPRTLLSAGDAMAIAAQVTDLAITEIRSTFFATMLPADKGKATVTVQNVGGDRVAGLVPILIELVDENNQRTLLGTINAAISLNPGKAKSFTLSSTLAMNIPEGQYQLVATLDGAGVEDGNAANDIAIDPRDYEVLYGFGNLPGRSSPAKFTFMQEDRKVTLSLSGREGSGLVSFTGGDVDINLIDTTRSSKVSISVSGGNRIATFDDITVLGSLSSFNGKSVDLAGNFIVSGHISTLSLHDLLAEHLVDIQGAADPSRSMTVSLNQARDLIIQSTIGIKSLTATNWLDDDAQTDMIAAPWIGSATIKGDFEASVHVTDFTQKQTLRSLSVAGTARGITVRTEGSIGSLTFGSLIDSKILSGMNESLSDLPDEAGDFQRLATIGSLTVKGMTQAPDDAAMVNSMVAAAHLGSVRLARVLRDNTGSPFGLAADTIKSLTMNFVDDASTQSFSKLDTQATFDALLLDRGLQLSDMAIRLFDLPQFSPPHFEVAAIAETEPVPSSGDAADDIAIWVHPSDASQSFIIGTNKAGGRNGGLFVYDLAGNLITSAAAGKSMNNIDVRQGFTLDGEQLDLFAVTNRSDHSIDLFTIDLDTALLTQVGSIDLGPANLLSFGEAYGLTMSHDADEDRYFVFASDKSGRIAQFELFAQGEAVVGELIRYWKEKSVVEGMVADDLTGFLYVGEETKGIYRYAILPEEIEAAPIASPPPADRFVVDLMAGPLDSDIEGLAIYRSQTDAYLIASCQDANRYVVYDLQTFWPVATFRIVATADGSIDGTSDTDGISAISGNFGDAFPLGLFIAQDGSNTGGRQNFKIVSWEDLAIVAGI